MIRRVALALFLTLAAGHGMATGLCLLPLEGGEPVNSIERRQPHRIISGSGSVPGLPLVLATPLNREGTDRQLYTVRGMRYEPLGEEFPRGALWVSKTAERPDGSIYGWELLGRRLYRFAPGEEKFLPVPVAEGANGFAYDPVVDRLYVRKDGQLYEIDTAGEMVASALGGWDLHHYPIPIGSVHHYPSSASSPRYQPVLGLHLSADSKADQLWLYGASGEWQKLEHGGPIRHAWRVIEGRWHHDSEAGIVTLLLGETALVLDARVPGQTRMLARIEFDKMASVPGLPLLLWRSHERPGFLVRRLTGNDKMRELPDLVMVTREGPVVPPGQVVVSHYPTDADGRESKLPHAGFLLLPEFGTFLIMHSKGTSAFLDGKVVTQPQLAPERLGRNFWAERFSGRTFLQSGGRLFELGSDLTPVAKPLPQGASRGWELSATENFRGAFLNVGLPEYPVWFTADGENFEAVENRTGGRVRDLGADLPGRRAMLAVTDTGAALITDCP